MIEKYRKDLEDKQQAAAEQAHRAADPVYAANVAAKEAEDANHAAYQAIALNPANTMQPDGSVQRADGSIYRYDGSILQEDGSVISPDGTVTQRDGTVINPDGTAVQPNGTTINADGSVVLSNGAVINPDGSHDPSSPLPPQPPTAAEK